MKKFIVCVRDIRADLFFSPMFYQSLGQAERQFADEVNRKDASNTLASHPADFELFHVGSFDDQTCTFDLLDKPTQLALGSNLVKSSQ